MGGAARACDDDLEAFVFGAIGEVIKPVRRAVGGNDARFIFHIKRIERKAKAGDNLSNEYGLRGLVKAAKTHAEEKIALKAKRAAEDKSRRATPTTFALIDGGKKS